jgi:hypothetical protein
MPAVRGAAYTRRNHATDKRHGVHDSAAPEVSALVGAQKPDDNKAKKREKAAGQPEVLWRDPGDVASLLYTQALRKRIADLSALCSSHPARRIHRWRTDALV